MEVKRAIIDTIIAGGSFGVIARIAAKIFIDNQVAQHNAKYKKSCENVRSGQCFKQISAGKDEIKKAHVRK